MFSGDIVNRPAHIASMYSTSSVHTFASLAGIIAAKADRTLSASYSKLGGGGQRWNLNRIISVPQKKEYDGSRSRKRGVQVIGPSSSKIGIRNSSDLSRYTASVTV